MALLILACCKNAGYVPGEDIAIKEIYSLVNHAIDKYGDIDKAIIGIKEEIKLKRN